MTQEPDLTSDRVEVVDQIRAVKFGLRAVTGTCLMCGEDEDSVLEICAAVYYPGRDKFGRVCMIESVWSQHFCPTCLSSFFNTNGAVKDENKGYQ